MKLILVISFNVIHKFEIFDSIEFTDFKMKYILLLYSLFGFKHKTDSVKFVLGRRSNHRN